MASDIFAKLGDIKGESTRRQAQGRDRSAVVVVGRDQRRARWRTAAAAARARPRFHDLVFMHNVDKASPVLMQACATGDAPEGSDDHAPQGRQGPAGIPRSSR